MKAIQSQPKHRTHPPDVSLFDCDIGIGESGLGHRDLNDPDELCAILDHYGVAESLVYDMHDVETGRFDFPSRLLEFCAKSNRLHPSAPIAPPDTREQAPPEEFVEKLIASGVRAVRAMYRWPMGWTEKKPTE